LHEAVDFKYLLRDLIEDSLGDEILNQGGGGMDGICCTGKTGRIQANQTRRPRVNCSGVSRGSDQKSWSMNEKLVPSNNK